MLLSPTLGNMGGPIQPSSEGFYSISHEGKNRTWEKGAQTITPLGSGPLLAEICNIFALPLARRGNWPLLPEVWNLLTTFSLLRKTRRTEGKWRTTLPPCIEGKCATSNRGMVHINPLNFLTEVYLLTLFPLVRKKHRTGKTKGGGDHIPPPKEGMCAPSAKNIN